MHYDSETQHYVWTDDLSPTAESPSGQTVSRAKIKATHAQEIRSAVDDARSRCGLSVYDWSWNPAENIQAGDRVTATQVAALRTAIKRIYTEKSIAAIAANTVWDTQELANTRISKNQFQDMRTALDNISNSCAGGPAPVCGNGLVEAGESCDDNNTADGDGCSSTCQTEVPVCWSSLNTTYPSSCPGGWIAGASPEGLGPCFPPGACAGVSTSTQQTGTCDPTDPSWSTCTCTGGDPTGCDGGVTPVVCTGTRTTTDTTYYECNAVCPPAPVCGNGVVEAGEQCDEGASNGLCPATCSAACTANACYCWRSQFNAASCGSHEEQDGSMFAGGACSTLGSCAGTSMDLGCGLVFSDTLMCAACGPYCGDGVVNNGEQCDAGAANGACPSACSANCTSNNCAVTVGPDSNACQGTCIFDVGDAVKTCQAAGYNYMVSFSPGGNHCNSCWYGVWSFSNSAGFNSSTPISSTTGWTWGTFNHCNSCNWLGSVRCANEPNAQ